VGTRAYREGVDVPGPACSLLVVDRIPFAPPDDPAAQKLRERVGKRALLEHFLPQDLRRREAGGRQAHEAP